jgi:nucleolar protein 4
VNGVIKGFAFVEYKKEKHAKNAVYNLNNKRKLYTCAIKQSTAEYLKSKQEYEQQKLERQTNTEAMQVRKKKKKQRKEKQKQSETEDEEMKESNGENTTTTASTSKSSTSNADKKKEELERTIFVRNLPADVELEDVQDMFTFYYGKVASVTIMPNPEIAGLSNGCAFVLFDNKASVEAVMKDVETEHRLREIEEHSKQEDENQSEDKLKRRHGPKKKEDAGKLRHGQVDKLEIEGRHVFISRAISREEAKQKKEADESYKQADRDKRNLYLASEGYVPKDSPIAATLPPKHLKKIQKNYQAKMEKLKSPMFHVSNVRLAVQHIPLNFTEKQLRQLFLLHSRTLEDKKLGPAYIVQCKIERERDSKKVDAYGLPPSKGFGFVQFSTHEHALAALRAINNNPNILENKKVKAAKINEGHRFIVEFALDNVRKLKMREEKLKQRQQALEQQWSGAGEFTRDKYDKRNYNKGDKKNNKNKKSFKGNNNNSNKRKRDNSSDKKAGKSAKRQKTK